MVSFMLKTDTTSVLSDNMKPKKRRGGTGRVARPARKSRVAGRFLSPAGRILGTAGRILGFLCF